MRAHIASHSWAEDAAPLLALVITWALVHGGVVVFRDVPFLNGTLVDTDSYMRLVRVSELAQGWQWFDNTIARANAPYGDTLHWTRPFDVLLLLAAQPATFAVNAESALFYAGYFVSPVLQLMTALLLAWALRPVIRAATWFLPAVALFVQPCALAYSLLGRADHHALLLLVFVVTAGFMLRTLSDPRDLRSSLAAGLATGFGLWLSVEFVLIVCLCLGTLGFSWLSGGRQRAAQGKWYALAMSVLLLLALFVERPVAAVFESSYDKVSSVHYLLGVGALLFWSSVERVECSDNRGLRTVSRLLLGAVGAGAVALLLAAVYPLFFAGPMAEVDPRIVPLWLNKVLEMRPLAPSDSQTLGRFIFYLGGVVLVALPFGKVLLEELGSRRFFAYLFIMLAGLLFTAVAMVHMRFAGYAEIAFVMAFAVTLDRFLLATVRIDSDLLRGLLRGSFISVMLLAPIFVGNALMTKPAEATNVAVQPSAGCNVGEVAALLESDPRWRTRPHTILAFMDIGPELLYRTQHRVIGTPYHRNGDGILDGHRLLATSDVAAAHDLARQRAVDLILLCRTSAERGFYMGGNSDQSLYSLLEGGSPPAWLVAVELPAALQGHVRLYQVLR